VEAHREELSRLDDRALTVRADRLRPTLRRSPLDRKAVAEAFALREAAGRSIGQRHYPVQLAGGWALMRGMIAEMERPARARH